MLVRTPSSGLPPGPKLPPPLQTLGWFQRPYPFVERQRRRFGDTWTMRIVGQRFVVLADPADVKQVFTGDPAVFHAGEGNVILLPFLGRKSVLLLDDAAHLRERKLLLPPFHGERMRRQVEVMREVAEREVAGWPRGEAFPVHPRMQDLTLEIVMRVVFGVADGDERLAALRGRLSGFLHAISSPREMRKLLVLGPERADRRRVFAHVLDPVHDVIAGVIAERRSSDDLDEREDILSMLLQTRHDDGSEMADDELRDELVTLLVAGHETTATALSWALERLTRHPLALERLTEEVRGGDDGYVDAVIRETMRLRPVLPFVVRRLTAPVSIGGWDLPPGTNVAPSIHLVHRRPELYPDPGSFRPERWLGVRPNPYTYFPFGGGVRRCLGASFAETEMHAVLRSIVAEVRLQPAASPPEHVARRVITLVPARGAEVLAA